MTIILLTQSYPYDAASEHIFIEPEIRHLVERWDRVILVPRLRKGVQCALLRGAEVADDYAEFLQRHLRPPQMIRSALSSRSFFHELRQQPSLLLFPSKILKLLLFSGRVDLTRQWVKGFLSAQHIDTSQCILYSYWFDHAATALAQVSRELPGVRAVSRAHGYDIYEEYYYPYYWPYRRDTLQALDVVFFASDAGREYYCERYPEFMSKYETAHLGTKDPGFVSRSSPDGVCRIISCAHIVPVKRVELLLDGIAEAARQRPAQRFEWIHFGDGTGRKSLDKRLGSTLPPNLHIRLPGDVPNPQVIGHYRDHPADVFVNVSSTEGGAPVAIQEAISCGIPVVATSAGGNPEVVSEKNGILLSLNPEPREIAAALRKIWENPGLAAQMRRESRRLWESSYNAEVNFRAFAERLKSIGER
jgi:colanic acid/amylovoran biosynthesis glycosyltransferase